MKNDTVTLECIGQRIFQGRWSGGRFYSCGNLPCHVNGRSDTELCVRPKPLSHTKLKSLHLC